MNPHDLFFERVELVVDCDDGFVFFLASVEVDVEYFYWHQGCWYSLGNSDVMRDAHVKTVDVSLGGLE